MLATVDDPQRYNDEVIFPDKVRINRYYLHHYSFWMDIKMIFATVLGKRMEYGGEVIKGGRMCIDSGSFTVFLKKEMMMRMVYEMLDSVKAQGNDYELKSSSSIINN